MSLRLLTEARSNPKTHKGIALGHGTAVLMLAHAGTSEIFGGTNVCPHASAGCAAACLGKQGRAAENKGPLGDVIRAARIWRTVQFTKSPNEFFDILVKDIETHVRRTKNSGLKPSVRLNGTSDVLWERRKDRNGKTVFEHFPKVQFFDYTAMDILKYRSQLPKNYYLTFSRKETTPDSVVIDHVRAGINVAVPFRVRKGQPLPKTYLGFRVIDGDISDLRFKDPRGVIVGLRAKGTAYYDKTGWVVQPEGVS